MRAGLSDEFLISIHATAMELTRTGRSYAPEIAKAHAVSPRTVHRWMYQAGKRGLVAPAPQGARPGSVLTVCPTCGGRGRVKEAK